RAARPPCRLAARYLFCPYRQCFAGDFVAGGFVAGTGRAFARGLPLGVARAWRGRHVTLRVGHIAPMRRVVRPGAARDFALVEVVIAIEIDVESVLPPVDTAPDRPAHAHAGCEGDDLAGAMAGWAPGERRILRMGPAPVHHTGIIDGQVILVRVRRLDHIN